MLTRLDPRRLLLDSFNAAVAAADPLQMLQAHLPDAERIAGWRRTVVVGAGKAAASMALAVERHWPAQAPLQGLVITRYGHGLPLQRVQLVEAGHPVPDQAGEQAAAQILALAESLQAGDLLLALVSGGGSALLSLPVSSVAMGDLKAVTRELLASGAPIEQMNVVRKHLSRIQGGQLALAAAQRGADVLALIVSDVTGDDPSAIASGPCSPDPSTYGDALAVLQRWGVKVPGSVREHLQAGVQGLVAETPKPGDVRLAHVRQQIVATPRRSLQAAAAVFERAGVRPIVLGDRITGEAREVGKVMAAMALEATQQAEGQAMAAPCALISGGECTVTLGPDAVGSGAGAPRGGRCSEFLLSLACELDSAPGIYALAADTDGIDGSEDNAGAWCAPDSLARMSVAGVSARDCLQRHDSWGAFAATGDLLVTGATRTNVNDHRAILVMTKACAHDEPNSSG